METNKPKKTPHKRHKQTLHGRYTVSFLIFFMAEFYNGTHFMSNICSEAWLKKENTYLSPQTWADSICPKATSSNCLGIEALGNCKALLDFTWESIRLWPIFSMALIIFCPWVFTLLQKFWGSALLQPVMRPGKSGQIAKSEFVFYNLCICLSRFSVFGRQRRFAIRSKTNKLSVRTISKTHNHVWLKRIQGRGLKQITKPYWWRIKHNCCCFLWTVSWAVIGGRSHTSVWSLLVQRKWHHHTDTAIKEHQDFPVFFPILFPLLKTLHTRLMAT